MTKPMEKWINFHWVADEEWLPVTAYPGYEVSNLGRVRSLMRSNARLMTPQSDKDGYLYLRLIRDGRYRKWFIHRLVAMAFVAARTDEKNFACHRNGINTQNDSGNLKWATQAENIADKIEHGTHQIGSKHGRASINEETAAEIKRLFRDIPKYKGKLKEIAARTGASYQTVSGVVHKGGWSHV